jgi:hypothetical protein
MNQTSQACLLNINGSDRSTRKIATQNFPGGMTSIVARGRLGHNKDKPPPKPIPEALRQFVNIQMLPVNPEKDIRGHGDYRIARAVYVAEDESVTSVWNVYKPTGLYMGTLTEDRVMFLHKQYQKHCTQPATCGVHRTARALTETLSKRTPAWQQEHSIEKSLGTAVGAHGSFAKRPRNNY